MSEKATAMGGGRPMWTWLPFVAAMLITSVVGLVLLKVYSLQAERRQDAGRSELVSQLSLLRARLEISLTAPLLITRGLVAVIIDHGGMTDGEFVSMAAILLQDYPSIRNLTMARGTVISAVYPVAANKAVLGVDYRSRLDQWPSVERAIKSRKAVVAGPVQLIQGGSALIGRVPAFLPRGEGRDPDFYGMISVVIDIPTVFESVGLDRERLGMDLAIRGRDGLGAEGAMIWGDERVFGSAPVEMDVTLPDGVWRMAAIPKGGWDIGDGELQVTGAMGMILFALTAIASFGSAFYVRNQRRSRRHIAESEERYRALVETAPMAVVVHGDGIIQFANTEAARMVCAPPGESLVGRKVLDLVHPDSRPDVSARVARVLGEDGVILSGPVRYLTCDGRIIHTEVTSTRISLGGAPVVLSVVNDVTLRHHAEAERERLLDSLRRSNEDLQQFAYIASHDLQEPLRNVASYVQLLARRYSGRLDHDADEFIAYAVKGTKRMQEMITNLLDYSRLHEDDEREERADCREVVDEVLGDLSAAIEETGAVVEIAEMPVVLARPRELSRIFQNLIGNAIKYRRADVIPRIRVSAHRDGEYWLFAIADNGIGMEPQYFERIFTLFQRLHSRETYDGTGIGLAICRKLVQHNGGRIWVESQAGHGSTFRFSMRAVD